MYVCSFRSISLLTEHYTILYICPLENHLPLTIFKMSIERFTLAMLMINVAT